MKKLYLALILASVSTVALAQTVTPADQILNVVKNNIMSSSIEYKSAPSIKSTATGFEVSIPDGMEKEGGKQFISGFSFPVEEDGEVASNKRYVLKLDKMAYIFPTVERLLASQNATYSNVNYIAKIIPALDIVESQEVTLNDLKIPFDESLNATASSIRLLDASTALDGGKVKQEDKMSVQGFTVTHPMGSIVAKSFDFEVIVPETVKSTSPMEQIKKTPSIAQKMSLNDVKISTIVPQSDMVSFNLAQSLNMKQDTQYNITVDLKLDMTDIKQGVTTVAAPGNMSFDITASGFTVEQLANYSEALDKVNETEKLPESPRKGVILKSVQGELDKAKSALTKNMVIDVNKVSADSDEYAMLLKGKVEVENETFKGTMQITNFEYLAPEPKKIDEAACQKLVDQMLENKMTPDEFRVAYEKDCDEGQGVLDALRPYAATAKKVKDDQGKDALLFDIEASNGSLFINGQKVDIDSSALLGM